MATSTRTRVRSRTTASSKTSSRAHERALVAVAEVILQHATLDDLIPRLIETLQRVMQVDNVAILRLDPSGRVLVMDSVRGPEEVVADQVRVPLGKGVAGRIAASGQPLIIPDLSKAEVVNLFLSQHLRSLLGVPLRVGSRTIGVIHVSTTESHDFTESDVALLQLVADRVALALDRISMVDDARAAQALAEQRAGQLEAIFASMTDGVFVMDAAGRVLQCNAAGARLLQLDKPIDYYTAPLDTRPIYTTVMDRFGNATPPEQWPFARILRGEILGGSTAEDIQLELRTGTRIVVNVTGAPVRDATGQIVAAVCICREVTERRALEQQRLKTLNAVLAMAGMLVQPDAAAEDTARQVIELACDIMDCARAALSIIDEKGFIVPFAVAGLSPQDEQDWWTDQRAQSMPLGEVADQDFVAAMRSGNVKIYDFTQPPYNRVPNRYAILTILVAPILVNGELIGYVALDRGREYHVYSPEEQRLASAVAQLAGLVIERERLLQERMKSQAQAWALQETMNRMQRFLGVTSHELRTPLTAMKANIQLAMRAAQKGLQSAKIPDPNTSQVSKALGLLESADRQADQMARFIGDLLDFTRIQAGILQVQLSPQDLVGLVRDVIEVQQRNWPKRKITLQAPEKSLTVSCDPDRISQVLNNLITNAGKYSPEDRPIQVLVLEQPDSARIAVTDQGPGLTEEQQAHIFDAFVQAEGVRQQAGGATGNTGLGLGLFICHAIVAEHGGAIGVESMLGTGSTFWFSLPLADPD